MIIFVHFRNCNIGICGCVRLIKSGCCHSDEVLVWLSCNQYTTQVGQPVSHNNALSRALEDSLRTAERERETDRQTDRQTEEFGRRKDVVKSSEKLEETLK